MKRISPLTLVGSLALLAAAVPAFAVAPDVVHVTNVIFSQDFDTATITLSKFVPNDSIRYDLLVDGEIRRGGGFAATDGTVTVQSGFRRDFLDEGGAGTYTLIFQACPQDETTILDVLKYCGPKYEMTVHFTASGFNDVSSSHPNYDAINYVQAQGIVSGYPDGTYKPDQQINRAELTKIVTLYKFGQEMVDMCGTGVRFSDVSWSAWYIKYLCRGQDSGIISGYPDGTFRPGNPVNFVEAAKIIAITDAIEANADVLPPDTGGPWYERYVRYLEVNNAIPMSITTFDQLITRGEMAEMIYRLEAGITDEPSQTYEELQNSSNGWISRSNVGRNFSLALPVDWKGISGYDGSFFEIGGEFEYEFSGYGDPQNQNSITVDWMTDDTVFRNNRSWLEVVIDLRISAEYYDLKSTQKEDGWTVYVFESSTGESVMQQMYMFEGEEGVVVLGISDSNAVTQQIIDSFSFSS